MLIEPINVEPKRVSQNVRNDYYSKHFSVISGGDVSDDPAGNEANQAGKSNESEGDE